MGNHVTVTIAGAQGRLALNMFEPVTIHNVLQSCRFWAIPRSASRTTWWSSRNRIADTVANLASALMLVTQLNPRMGYDEAVKIGKLVLAENITLKQAAEKLGHVRAEEFDRRVVPA